MEGVRWPSLAIQGIILALNIPFLLSGDKNGYIIISVSIILVLMGLQLIHQGFLYHDPFNSFFMKKTKSLDTIILYIAILSSIFFFSLGATRFLGKKYSLLLSIVILLSILGLYCAWFAVLNRVNHQYIISSIIKRGPYRVRVFCDSCNATAWFIRHIIRRDSKYYQQIRRECEGDCEDRIVKEEPINIR